MISLPRLHMQHLASSKQHVFANHKGLQDACILPKSTLAACERSLVHLEPMTTHAEQNLCEKQQGCGKIVIRYEAFFKRPVQMRYGAGSIPGSCCNESSTCC
mmetsp:Transcript_1030/g.1307  ORF Transcript_1030/g.1307 Transcript_1030/m.1307 type:complete len:102 (-) Transcript_1030:209-514(-)